MTRERMSIRFETYGCEGLKREVRIMIETLEQLSLDTSREEVESALIQYHCESCFECGVVANGAEGVDLLKCHHPKIRTQ